MLSRLEEAALQQQAYYTMRDKFATAAMQSILSTKEAESYEQVAKLAYEMADRMLEARRKGE